MSRPADRLAGLVRTVRWQSTNDRNRDVAYLRLRERFPAWEAVRDAPVAEIEAAGGRAMAFAGDVSIEDDIVRAAGNLVRRGHA